MRADWYPASPDNIYETGGWGFWAAWRGLKVALADVPTAVGLLGFVVFLLILLWASGGFRR